MQDLAAVMLLLYTADIVASIATKYKLCNWI